jgi:hypothetical protein
MRRTALIVAAIEIAVHVFLFAYILHSKEVKSA